MTIVENKLILTEAEEAIVKKANYNAGPYTAAMFLRAGFKNHLEESYNADTPFEFYLEAIKLYRAKNFEVR